MACSWSQATDVDRTKVFHATCMNALCSHLFSSPLGCFHSLFALLRNTSCCMMIMLETTKLSVGLYISRTGKRHPVRVLQRVLDAGSPDQCRHHRKRHEPLVEHGRRGGRQKDTNGWDKRLHAVPKGDGSVKGFPGAGRCGRVVVTRQSSSKTQLAYSDLFEFHEKIKTRRSPKGSFLPVGVRLRDRFLSSVRPEKRQIFHERLLACESHTPF